VGTTRLRGRPRNRWQDEVREDGRVVDGEEWKEKLHNREEWKKLLENAKESLHSAHANGMNECLFVQFLICVTSPIVKRDLHVLM